MNELAFVAGATGLTGRHVVDVLAATGRRPVAHVRPDRTDLDAVRRRYEALGAEVDTTPWALDPLTATLTARTPAVVFALLGTTRRRAKAAAAHGARADYEAVDFGLTRLLIDACVQSGHRPRFVYLSATGADKSGNAYYRARARTEAYLQDSGLPFTIARPSFIVGDREAPRRLENTAAAVSDGALRLVGALGARRVRDRYRSITGEALAAALVRLAWDPAAENRVVEREALAG